MATKIGKLTAILGLDSRKFGKGLKDSETRAERFGRTMRGIGKAAALAAAAAVTGAALAIRQQLNAADEMAKAAQRIGLPIEQLSKLRHAANLSGVAAQDLDKSMAKLSSQMAAAAGGNKAVADQFAALGVSVTDATGKMRPATDVLMDMADRLNAMPAGAAKTAAMAKLLGEELGPKLIPMLNQGSAGIAEMMADAEALGLVFDAKTGAAAERFNDNLTRLKGAFNGLMIQLTAAFAPALAQITDGLVAGVKSMGGMANMAQGLASVVGDLWVILRDTATGLNDLRRSAIDGALGLFGVSDGANTLGRSILTVIARARDLIGWFAGLLRATGGWGGALEELGKVAAAVWEYIKSSAKSLGPALGAVWADIKSGFVSMIAGIQQQWYMFLVAVSQSAMRMGWDDIGAKIAGGAERVGESLDATIGVMGNFRGEAERLRGEAAGMIAAGAEGVAAAVGRLNAKVKEGQAATEEAASTVKELSGALDEVGGTGAATGAGAGSGGRAASAIGQVADAAKSAAEDTNDLADKMAGLFDGMITQGKSASSVLRQMAGQLESKGWQMLFRAALSGSGFGGGSGAGGGGIFGKILGGLFGGFRENGGPVRAGVPYVVGEKRPELFVPNTSGRIIPRVDGGRGGRDFRVSVGFDGTMGAFTARVFDATGRQIAQGMEVVQSEMLPAASGSRFRGRK